MNRKTNKTDILIDHDKPFHIRAMYPHAEEKFQNGEYHLKWLKVKNLSTLHKHYLDVSDEQFASIDEITMSPYNIQDNMTSDEHSVYKLMTRTLDPEEYYPKFFVVNETKNLQIWNFTTWEFNSFKAITFKITDDIHKMIDGLFIYNRNLCSENIYDESKLEYLLSTDADTRFKLTYQAMPVRSPNEKTKISLPRMLRVYDFEAQ